MASENSVVWINQQEGDAPLVYVIPAALFGTKLPELERFVAAVTNPMNGDEDGDSTVGPTDSEGEADESESKHEAAHKRAKLDPVEKAFRSHVTASEYMEARLKEIGVPVHTGPWNLDWKRPLRVVLSIGFEL